MRMKAEEAFRKMREIVHAPRTYGSYNDVEKARLIKSIREKRSLERGLSAEEKEFLAADAAVFKPEDNLH